jgi:hypothetical protein
MQLQQGHTQGEHLPGPVQLHAQLDDHPCHQTILAMDSIFATMWYQNTTQTSVPSVKKRGRA